MLRRSRCVLIFLLHLVAGMVINLSVQYNGRSLSDIILLNQGYHHWGTHSNVMKRL